MQLVDPTVTSNTPQRQRAPALETLEDKRIGILSNGKANADKLLLYTAEQFQQNYGGTILETVYKHHASEPSTTELLTNLSHEADYVITAAGD